MFNIENYIKDKKINDYNVLIKNIKSIITATTKQYFADKTMFKNDDFSYYFYDEFVTQTNCGNNTFMNIYIEINQEKNIKENLTKKAKNNIVKELHLPLENIKKGLYDVYLNTFGNNVLIWQDRYSVNLQSFEEDDNNNEIVFNVRIYPCFTYKNSNNINGVIYYDNSKKMIEIEYPKIAIKNLNKKDKETNGLYKKYIVLFKNMFLEQKKANNVPFEIFETMLYNVPNDLYADLTGNSIFKIINYLRNKNFKDYVTVDEQDKAFTSVYKSLSIVFAKHIISQIEKFIKKSI
jgi:hypothetical protein